MKFGLIGHEIVVTGGDRSDVDQDDGSLAGILTMEIGNQVARKTRALLIDWREESLRRSAGGECGRGRCKEAVADQDSIFFQPVMRDARPDVSEKVPCAKTGGITGEGDGFLGMGEQDVASFGGTPMAQQLKHAFSVDGLVPGISARFEAVRGELDEQDARLWIGRQKMVEGEISGHGEDSVGNGNIAGPKAGLGFKQVGVDPGHRSRVAEDEDVAVAIAHVKDGIVGAHPHAGAMMEKEVRPTEGDARRNGKKRKKNEENAVAKEILAPLRRGYWEVTPEIVRRV